MKQFKAKQKNSATNTQHQKVHEYNKNNNDFQGWLK